MKAKTCAILGSTPIDFPWGYDEEDERCHMMKLMLLQGISYCRSLGIRRFSVAIDSGVGLYASEIINSLRNEDREMKLVCYVPSEEQATILQLFLWPCWASMLSFSSISLGDRST